MLGDQLKRHVGIALVRPSSQSELFSSSPRDMILRALDPKMKVERYRRLWRISKLQSIEDVLCGKLGFSKSRLTEETFYDENASDFITLEKDSREGAVSCFVLHQPDIESGKMILAFEEHPPDIRRQSFIGAFNKFLTDARSGYEVESIRREIDFVSWLNDMDLVTEFTGTFKRPNPQWRPRTEQVREIIEETRADKMKLVAKVEGNREGLDIAGSILGGIVEHSKGGYGDYIARGFRSESEFNYRHGASEIIEEIIEEPSDTHEDIFRKLIGVVKNIRSLL